MSCKPSLSKSVFPSVHRASNVPAALLGGGGLVGLSKWVAAKALVADGTRNALVVCLGDSTTRGSNPGIIQAELAYPGLLAGLIASGSRSSVAGFSTLDSDLSVGAGWVAANSTIGGLNWETNTATQPISYTPSNAVNTFDVWYIDFSGAGAFTLDIDGGTPQTVTPLGTKGFRKATITTGGVAGTKTLNILRGSGYASIAMIRAYDSATKEVSVLNSGVSGWKVANWAAGVQVWDARQALTALAPDLTIICLTINDWIAGTNVATFKTHTQALIDSVKATGSVLLVTGVPTDTAFASLVQQQSYIDVYHELLAENPDDCALLDMTLEWGSWAAANANGWMSDYAHPSSPSGYEEWVSNIRAKL